MLRTVPDTGEIERAQEGARSARDVADACARARAAQTSFASSSLRARAALLRRLRRALLARAEELIAVVVAETGKVRAEAITLEMAPAALALTWAAAAGPRCLADERMPRFLPIPRRASRSFHPRGVVGLISPYNYTVSIPMSTIAAALVAGNGVVWKPAETGTGAARKIVELFEDAGLPHGLVSIVEGGPDAGRALVDAPIDHLTFIGSTAAGRSVAARCGQRLLPCVVELGGKAPAIVLDDADLERASRAIVYGGLANAGQSCIAVERVFAVESVFDELVSRTAALAAAVRPGVEVAALAPRRAERLAVHVADAHARGARFHGDHVVDVTGLEARALDDEIFGPLIPFVRVGNVDEAVHASNAHRQQLCAYVFSGSAARAREVARRLTVPHVVINDAMVSYAMMELPFGGEGSSGLGRVHGVEGLRALAREQILVEGHLPLAKEPWWLPYDGRLTDLLLENLERALTVWEGSHGAFRDLLDRFHFPGAER